MSRQNPDFYAVTVLGNAANFQSPLLGDRLFGAVLKHSDSIADFAGTI
jgi:hypothetical protein